MSAIEKGDVVQLKSGGPMMTVSEVGDYSRNYVNGPQQGVKCIWFDGSKTSEQVFDAAVLAKYED